MPVDYETLIQEIEVTNVVVAIKFTRTLKLSSITNDKFTVTNLDTSTTVTNPFEEILLTEDYNSIGRILQLHWVAGKLQSNTDYRLTVADLVDAAGSEIDAETYNFTTGEIGSADVDDDGDLGSDTNIVIEDYSIKINPAEPSSTDITIISGTSSNFYVVTSDPESGEYYLDNDYANGRVTIKFSADPEAQYINTDYFKGQRKPIKRGPSKWENLDVHVSKHSTKPWVYVDFPSLDSTPVYGTIGSEYFETNYKYRILISKDVSS